LLLTDPGELASFLRIDHIVDAALASSAPVNYRVGGTPAGTFFKVGSGSIALASVRFSRACFCQVLSRSLLSASIALACVKYNRARFCQPLFSFITEH
jgi:hypothetical protein